MLRIKLTCTCFLCSVLHADGDSRQRVSLVMSPALLICNSFTHLHANKLVRFIHQAAKHPDMPTDARTIYDTTLDQIVQDFALKPSPATTERFDAIFTSLLTKLKTHGVSATRRQMDCALMSHCTKSPLEWRQIQIPLLKCLNQQALLL